MLKGFAGTLATLFLVSTLIVPRWPLEMLGAPRVSPIPTHFFLWIGTVWYLVLQTIGLRGWPLWACYAVVSILYLWAVLQEALDDRIRLDELLSLSLVAAFFVAPYGRHDDFPVLLIPAFILAKKRLPIGLGTALLICLLVRPYGHFALMERLSILLHGSIRRLGDEFTFFWIPLSIAALWAVSGLGGSSHAESVNPR